MKKKKKLFGAIFVLLSKCWSFKNEKKSQRFYVLYSCKLKLNKRATERKCGDLKRNQIIIFEELTFSYIAFKLDKQIRIKR